eukprot:TRINITY_DN67_c4_g1_i1.p1 TRINITY_DN67_c4_g1~~TRINITY_DN67_c4_g1_i1.p1  ORF type:complete len:152 (+),score=27.91 TRINITY_DN67_c4_g1_i1:63-518(+)
MSKVTSLAKEFDLVESGKQEEVSEQLKAKSDFVTYAKGEHLPKIPEKIAKKQINVASAAAAFDQGEAGNPEALLQQSVDNDGSAALCGRVTEAKPTPVPGHRTELAEFQYGLIGKDYHMVDDPADIPAESNKLSWVGWAMSFFKRPAPSKQ